MPAMCAKYFVVIAHREHSRSQSIYLDSPIHSKLYQFQRILHLSTEANNLKASNQASTVKWHGIRFHSPSQHFNSLLYHRHSVLINSVVVAATNG